LPQAVKISTTVSPGSTTQAKHVLYGITGVYDDTSEARITDSTTEVWCHFWVLPTHMRDTTLPLSKTTVQHASPVFLTADIDDEPELWNNSPFI
jgi:hypothetical protein